MDCRNRILVFLLTMIWFAILPCQHHQNFLSHCENSPDQAINVICQQIKENNSFISSQKLSWLLDLNVNNPTENKDKQRPKRNVNINNGCTLPPSKLILDLLRSSGLKKMVLVVNDKHTNGTKTLIESV